MSDLVVDGYNVIYAWLELAPLIRRGEVEEARRRLVAMLGEYAAATGDNVTVVFDAHERARGGDDGQAVDGVRVIFGSKGWSADHVIERLVGDAKRRGDAGRMTVATGDRLQRDLVMSMGGAVISPEALRQQVLATKAGLDDHRERRHREARFANRLEDRIDPEARRRLEALRRPARDGRPGD